MSDDDKPKKLPSFELHHIVDGNDSKPHFTKLSALFPTKDGESHSGRAVGAPGRYLIRPVQQRLKDAREAEPNEQRASKEDHADEGHEA